MVMQIGSFQLPSAVVAAPMAGVTDLPYRRLCRAWHAGLMFSEMIASAQHLRDSAVVRRRMNHCDEPSPRAVQIVGADPRMMVDAARYNVDRGAQIIDINMGCPAKKVCNSMAGSALLADERRVAAILEAVVAAVDVPVTLKMRTGPSPERRNGVSIARIAESAGVQALAVHGRTRACKFRGRAEYATIRAIKQAVNIPVFANGDIDSPQKAKEVLDETGADGIMIGRAAQGRPWLFKQVDEFLRTGVCWPEPGLSEQRDALLQHLKDLYAFYGKYLGVRIARKHICWYLKTKRGGGALWNCVNQITDPAVQYRQVKSFFDQGPYSLHLAA